MKKKIISLLLACVLVCSVTGVLAETSAPASQSAPDLSDYFSKRDLSGAWDEKEAVRLSLNGESAQCDSDSVSISGGEIVISAAGTYLITGTLTDGTIQVNAGDDDKVQLVLQNASITSASSAAIYVENADKVFITLAEGSENVLKNGGAFDETSGIDAVVFSRDDLNFNGTGSLTVLSPAGHGIVGKDDLKFASGTYTIDALNRGIDANDSIRIYDGTFAITAMKDGLRAKNDEDETKGWILIAGGTFQITAGGGAQNGAAHTDSMFFGRQQMNRAASQQDTSSSGKGVKASGNLIILGGTIQVDAADDAFHTGKDLTVWGGTILAATGDDGFHADGALTIAGGDIVLSQSYEGLEAKSITISGGNISVTASDDGLNAAGGNDSSGFRFNDMFSSDGVSIILISGGTLHVNADGDGIDSNGDLKVTGGAIIVSGPTNSGNGALDCAGTATITGGTIIAAGAAGMAENFDTSSTQPAILISLSGNAGSTITVSDAKGSVLITGTVEKRFETVVISSPDLKVGETYTISAGGSSATVTPTSIITGGGMGFGGMGGFGGGGRNWQNNQGTFPGGMDGQNGQGGYPGGQDGQGGQGGFPGGQDGQGGYPGGGFPGGRPGQRR